MGENYIYISKQAMTIFPENNEEIKYKSSFNFDNDFSKMDFNLNPYMEYISKENAILETDKNINFFPLYFCFIFSIFILYSSEFK